MPDFDPDSEPPEIDLGEALASLSVRAGRARHLEPPSFEVLRELTPQDLEIIQKWGEIGRPSGAPTVAKLRTSHHRMAQLLAEGHPPEEVSALTGYRVEYIRDLASQNLAFKALLDHYLGVAEVRHVDTMERLRSLGLDAADELQARLAENPEEVSTPQLMGMIDMALVRPVVAAMKATGQVEAAKAAPQAFQVVFRSAGGAPAPIVIENETKGE